MATFVQLINWTDQGVRTARETTARADAYAQLLERMGGRLKEVYWTLGQYDIVAQGDGRTYFAGEHVSHIPAWQEGAILSALDTLPRLHARVINS